MAVEIERKYLVDTVYGRRFWGNTSTRLRFNFHHFNKAAICGLLLFARELAAFAHSQHSLDFHCRKTRNNSDYDQEAKFVWYNTRRWDLRGIFVGR